MYSQVYGGYAGFFDYGPLGVELRKNIKDTWWRDMVHRRADVVGLDSSIIGSPQIWRASGHVDGFSDPMVDCKESKLRYRADQLFWTRAEVDGENKMDRDDAWLKRVLLAEKTRSLALPAVVADATLPAGCARRERLAVRVVSVPLAAVATSLTT